MMSISYLNSLLMKMAMAPAQLTTAPIISEFDFTTPPFISIKKANIVLTAHLNRFWGTLIAVTIFGLLFWLISHANFLIVQSPELSEASPRHSTLKQVGVNLMTSHVWAFEVAAILLLVALVGAAYLAFQREKEN